MIYLKKRRKKHIFWVRNRNVSMRCSLMPPKLMFDIKTDTNDFGGDMFFYFYLPIIQITYNSKYNL